MSKSSILHVWKLSELSLVGFVDTMVKKDQTENSWYLNVHDPQVCGNSHKNKKVHNRELATLPIRTKHNSSIQIHFVPCQIHFSTEFISVQNWKSEEANIVKCSSKSSTNIYRIRNLYRLKVTSDVKASCILLLAKLQFYNRNAIEN